MDEDNSSGDRGAGAYEEIVSGLEDLQEQVRALGKLHTSLIEHKDQVVDPYVQSVQSVVEKATQKQG